MRINYFKIVFIFIFSLGLLMPNIVFANANFGDFDYRTNYNSRMYSTSNNQGKLTIDRYRDKSLSDMYETGYKQLSSSNQILIKNFANQIINSDTSLTNLEKLSLFHNFLRDNMVISSNPEVTLGSNYNNPITIINYYNSTNSDEIPAKSNGYAALFVALARSYNIPARVVNGYYEMSARNSDMEWGSNISENQINHIWCQAYVDGRWVMIDIVADDYENKEDITLYGDKYFDVSYENLSKTHIMFSYRYGSRDKKYIDNSYETSKLKGFLSKKFYKVTNGRRLNIKYNTTTPSTWFSPYDKTSIGDGSGRLTRLYFPKYKKLRGYLDISGFPKLTYFAGSCNRISSTRMINNPSLKTIYLGNNQIETANFGGNKSLTYLSLTNNPLTSARYSFNKGTSTGVVKTNTGGTFSVMYQKTSKGYRHEVIAKVKSGYTFKGWYLNGTRLTANKKLVLYRNKSFALTAKYTPKTYIIVSVKNQKFWYYKYGKLVMSSGVVTGNRGNHDTPKGTYYIRNKARNIYLVGDDYQSWVNYWMLISPRHQIGLHDATWRSSFGGNIYKWDGSHGCVNLPYSKARTLYYKAPIGTKVIIK